MYCKTIRLESRVAHIKRVAVRPDEQRRVVAFDPHVAVAVVRHELPLDLRVRRADAGEHNQRVGLVQVLHYKL